MEDVNAYMEIIKENIEYEHHMKYGRWQDKGLYEELYEVICEIVCVKHKTVKIGGNDYPYELVKSKFLKLNSSHLEYVIGCMQETTTKIANIKAYMVTALYNAPSTMNHYYQQEVQLKELLSSQEYASARESTLNAHYTSPAIIRSIYDTLDRMGFEKGNVLEPAMGIGNFFGMLPEKMQESRLYGVELDGITGRIARQLYPKADIKISGFEKQTIRMIF